MLAINVVLGGRGGEGRGEDNTSSGSFKINDASTVILHVNVF
jgi:hypothetical protein